MYELDLVNEHNLAVFDRLNKKPCKLDNQYDGTLNCVMFYQEGYGWIVTISFEFKRDSQTAQQLIPEFDWRYSDAYCIPCSPHNIFIDGTRMDLMLKDNKLR